jgi:hypothetical protein
MQSFTIHSFEFPLVRIDLKSVGVGFTIGSSLSFEQEIRTNEVNKIKKNVFILYVFYVLCSKDIVTPMGVKQQIDQQHFE